MKVGKDLKALEENEEAIWKAEEKSQTIIPHNNTSKPTAPHYSLAPLIEQSTLVNNPTKTSIMATNHIHHI